MWSSRAEAFTSGGDWHEAMNFAGIHDLPVIFLIENNAYSISMPEKMQVAGAIARRAEGYGFPGVSVDGNHVLAVYEVAKEAVERAAAAKAPRSSKLRRIASRPTPPTTMTGATASARR